MHPLLACALLALAIDETTPAWRTAAPLLHARSAHALVGTGKQVYALAGTGADEPEAKHASPVLEIERFDGQQWSLETKLPGAGLNAPAAALVGERLYVLGGFNLLTNVPSDEVCVYDLATHAWSKAAALPAPRGGHAAVVLEGKIHLLGGGNSVSTLADHDEYDPATDKWTKRAPLPRGKGSPAAVAFEGKIWAIGGRSGPADFGEVDLWDPKSDKWSPGPAIEARGTAGAVVYRDSIWVFGGESQKKDACLDEVLRLDRASNTWKVATHLPSARNYARAVLFGDEVLVAGGSLSAGSSHEARGSRLVECMKLPAAR
jgi:N-acetylneuraminic acid mutarotase